MVAVTVGATQVAVSKERRTWESIASTALPGRRVLLDLLRGTVLSCAAPLGLGIALVSGAVLHHGDAGRLLAVALSLATMVVLAAVLGLASSCCMRSAAGALAVSLGVLAAAPLAGWAAAGILTVAFDPANWFQGSGGMEDSLRFAGVILGAAVVAGALASAVVLRAGLRGRRPRQAFAGLLVAVTIVVPAWATHGLSDDPRATEIFGGFATLIACYIQCVSGNVELDTASLLGGAALQLFLASAIAFVAWTQADAWLGREG